jgi:hypothetical protein
VHYGIFGPAFANLISFTVYNFIRYMFLLRKFNMQPFTGKTLEVLVIAGLSYTLTYFIFRQSGHFVSLLGASVVYSLLFGSLMIWRKISPDVEPVIGSAAARLGIRLRKEPPANS